MKLSISGKIAAGKTEIAKILRDNHNYQIVTLSTPIQVAELLARSHVQNDFRGVSPIVGYLLHLTHTDNVYAAYNAFLDAARDNEEELRSGKKPRGFRQQFGTAMRELDLNVFVRSAIDSVQKENVVCDDLRMVNEATAFRQAGFKLVRVEVDEAERMRRVEELGYDKSRLNHVTETALDNWTDWDYVFDGNCGKDELAWQVSAMLDLLK